MKYLRMSKKISWTGDRSKAKPIHNAPAHGRSAPHHLFGQCSQLIILNINTSCGTVCPHRTETSSKLKTRNTNTCCFKNIPARHTFIFAAFLIVFLLVYIVLNKYLWSSPVFCVYFFRGILCTALWAVWRTSSWTASGSPQQQRPLESLSALRGFLRKERTFLQKEDMLFWVMILKARK